MSYDNPLLEKSLKFASRIVRLYQYLLKEKHEVIISKQYWLRLLVLSEYITEAEGDSLINDCMEIKRILISSLNTAKQKDN